MIVDDILGDGLHHLGTSLRHTPQVFRVPFRVAPRHGDGADGCYWDCETDAAWHRFIRPHPEGLGVDGSWAKSPYPYVLVTSTGLSERAVLAIYTRGPDDPSVPAPNVSGEPVEERWHLCAITDDGHGRWHPFYTFVDRSATGLLTVMAMESETHWRHWATVTATFVRMFRGQRDADVFGQRIFDDRAALEEYWRRSTYAMATVTIALFNLLNTRNITTETTHPEPRVQRSRQQRGERPLVSYHILRVVPLSRGRGHAPSSAGGAPLPLHWIRGHFKTFTPERPLFGTLSGRFWWQPALHGRDRAHRVEKSYEVVAPCRVDDRQLEAPEPETP